MDFVSIKDIRTKLQNKEVSAVEITKNYLNRIDNVEQDVKAFITVTKEEALKNAEAIDKRIADGQKLTGLQGTIGALKDNICTKGIKTTCASQILKDFVPPYNSTVMEKLGENSIIIGKANMDEFAMGGSTENSSVHMTRNPWDLACVPGGSSGGSAAAVAAGEAMWALGSDTGGSIRQPASFCGVVGLKPTYGLVSRFGLVAYASSLDQIGPITNNVSDCAEVLEVIAGHDPKDSTSINAPVPKYTDYLKADVKGLKIGVPKEYFAKGIDSEVLKYIHKAIEEYKALGAEIVEVSMPNTEYALAAYYIIATAEASSNLARYDGVSFGHRTETADDIISMYKKTRSEAFGAEVKRRIMLGTYVLSSGYYDAYYAKALKVRTLVKSDFDQAFGKVDMLLTPTAPTPAFKLGEINDPLTMYLQDIYTIPVNLAGVPAISIPCGYKESLPIGMQLIGKPLGEKTLIQAAYTFEQQNVYYKRRASIGGKC